MCPAAMAAVLRSSKMLAARHALNATRVVAPRMSSTDTSEPSFYQCVGIYFDQVWHSIT